MGGQIVSSPTEIQEKLCEISPVRVAVAFIGKSWEKYVVAKDLSEIVISPTIGSNPRAIEDISKKIGWDKIYFLDNLHSKIFIGKDSALLGSCNLSDNGMGEGGLEETAIILQEKHHLDHLHKIIDNYKKLAQKMYPDESSKQARLRELIQQTKDMPRYFPRGTYGKTAPDINSYTLCHPIHIAFYFSGKLHINEKIVRANSDVPPSQEVEDYYTDYMEFRNEDRVEKGDWILCWRTTNKGLPSGNVEWMYVDEVIKDGCDNAQYKKLVGQIYISLPLPPFNLDQKAIKRIRDVIASDEFKILRPPPGDEAWDSNRADKLVPQFIEAIKMGV